MVTFMRYISFGPNCNTVYCIKDLLRLDTSNLLVHIRLLLSQHVQHEHLNAFT